MTPWRSRPAEERSLLNPAFCSCLLWNAASGYKGADVQPLPFDLAFLVLPIVLHRATRESLPRAPNTSLVAWLHDNPLPRVNIPETSRSLAPFTREAMIFGATHRILSITPKHLIAEPTWRTRITQHLAGLSTEVADCAKRAMFVGKWFARAGSPATVMAVLGVRP
jgi:Family of unknown function (DUF6521)